MTAHLIIQKRHGSLTRCIGYDIAGRTTKLDPEPIAQVLLTEADLALGGRALFDRWVNENVPVKPVPVALPTQSPADEPVPQVPSADPSEIHIAPAASGPLVLPDGRQVEVGDGLVVMAVGRFAELIEAARFGRQSTDI